MVYFCFPIFLAGHELCRLEGESGYLSFAFLAIGRENLEGHMLLMDEPSVSMRLAQWKPGSRAPRPRFGLVRTARGDPEHVTHAVPMKTSESEIAVALSFWMICLGTIHVLNTNSTISYTFKKCFPIGTHTNSWLLRQVALLQFSFGYAELMSAIR